jgi:hypothetical protein
MSLSLSYIYYIIKFLKNQMREKFRIRFNSNLLYMRQRPVSPYTTYLSHSSFTICFSKSESLTIGSPIT